MVNDKNIASSSEDFLREEGILEEVQAAAVKCVLAWPLSQEGKDLKDVLEYLPAERRAKIEGRAEELIAETRAEEDRKRLGQGKDRSCVVPHGETFFVDEEWRKRQDPVFPRVTVDSAHPTWL